MKKQGQMNEHITRMVFTTDLDADNGSLTLYIGKYHIDPQQKKIPVAYNRIAKRMIMHCIPTCMLSQFRFRCKYGSIERKLDVKRRDRVYEI